MRVIHQGDKLAVAAHRLKRTSILDLSRILTTVFSSTDSQEYYVEVHNLSVTEILSDPYIEFKAVDEKGELWYGLLADRKDKYINISNLTVAFPASMYNPHTSNIDKNGYFDVTAVLHELKKNMKNTVTPEKARDCGVLYKKIRQALNEL